MTEHNKQAEEVLKLWEPLQQNAYRIVYSIVNETQATEDVLQEALCRAFQKFHTLRDKSKFKTWFFTIAVRLAYKEISNRKRVILVDTMSDATINKGPCNLFVSETLLHVERKTEVIRIIMMLPERERHLFHLRYVQDIKVSDIAKMTDIKLSTLKSIYHRAHKKLYDLLSEEEKI
ncbi:MAG: RNA polymerase sigma factor [Clostridiales bacterium]|nr:RNA polymerase sigma factor [Clostridiales bacterium]